MQGQLMHVEGIMQVIRQRELYRRSTVDSTFAIDSGLNSEHLRATGSDLLGQCSAALAAISIVFEKTDPSYALELLAHARDLYACADPNMPCICICIWRVGCICSKEDSADLLYPQSQ